ncbi:MAG: hypothetical protein A3B23_03140 [Candidatus Colwellbacteria bacterium RIFCSPLOWO2_01_FULL_48_10]|uniref:Uncharacterized protein n=2 Tax=Bacteria candidate phyla TaxID=1783234 RepID=A0A1F5P2M5_9BACT|nr:MAG: hypothetical protein A2846_00290 [Candidatus Doudnabacteria bacterium RIFCSPHIGHO2_01_FULL_49_9]OGY60058.1 MAG: hypothetical protein A3B23_03140 [Candidatus Colwellbacteria bacterium RIFCSPLOWO2_01_FULL_48_10]
MRRYLLIGLALLGVLLVWRIFRVPPVEGQTQLAVLSTTEFQGDLVKIRNVRNFRYGPLADRFH